METGEQIEIALDETFEDKFDDIAVQYMFHDIRKILKRSVSDHGFDAGFTPHLLLR